jgi:hypothetical protein
VNDAVYDAEVEALFVETKELLFIFDWDEEAELLEDADDTALTDTELLEKSDTEFTEEKLDETVEDIVFLLVTVATDEIVSKAVTIDDTDINDERVTVLDTVFSALLLNVADGEALWEIANEYEFVFEAIVEKLGTAVDIGETVFVMLTLVVPDWMPDVLVLNVALLERLGVNENFDDAVTDDELWADNELLGEDVCDSIDVIDEDPVEENDDSIVSLVIGLYEPVGDADTAPVDEEDPVLVTVLEADKDPDIDDESVKDEDGDNVELTDLDVDGDSDEDDEAEIELVWHIEIEGERVALVEPVSERLPLVELDE